MRDRVFYSGMAMAAAVAVFVGFAPTYYLRPYFQTTSLAPILRLHGLVFTAWILLLVAQRALVVARAVSACRFNRP